MIFEFIKIEIQAMLNHDYVFYNVNIKGRDYKEKTRRELMSAIRGQLKRDKTFTHGHISYTESEAIIYLYFSRGKYVVHNDVTIITLKNVRRASDFNV